MPDTEPCGLSICAAPAGHDGTCAQASGWATTPPSARPAMTADALIALAEDIENDARIGSVGRLVTGSILRARADRVRSEEGRP